MALVNPEPIEFTTFGDMAAHLDRWATRSLTSPAEWTDVLVASQSWLDYSARNQALLASYDVVGPVAGRETWRLVPSTADRLCDVRAGEHGYPVRVPVTTGGTEPDPYLGGQRPTRAAVERWEWQPVYSVDQLARRPAPDGLASGELPEALRGPGADGEFLTAVRKVATATVRGRLPRSDSPDQILTEAAARLRRSSKRPELEPELGRQVAWLVAERVGHAATAHPPEFDPSGLSGRQRWERLVDVLEPARKLTAALGVATGVDLTASPLPRMTIVDDRVVPAGRRHRLPAASLEQLPVGRWVTVGPYTTAEWAARGESASGQGAYLRLNKTAYLVAVEQGDTAGWRLEDVAARTGHGLLATGTATSLGHARDDAVTATRDRYPAVANPHPEAIAVSTSPGGAQAGWEEMPGPGRTRAELRRLDEHTTVYVMAGPGGRWQPALHTATSGTLERLPLEATLDDARNAAELAGLRAIRVASVSDPARGDVALAEFANSPHYERRELAALVSHRLDPDDAQRLLSAEPAELVELLGAAGASPATTVAVLAAEHCDPATVAGLLPTVGVPMPDAIRALRDRWELPATVAAERLGATATEMRQAGCTPVEIMATRPRDVLRTLPDTPHLWELAAGTMATAGHPLGQIAAHLAAHAPTPNAFAAGLTAVAEPTDGLALAAVGRAHPDQLAAATEAWGLDPHDTAIALARVAPVDVVLDTLAVRCDRDHAVTAHIANSIGIASADVDRWLQRDAPTPVTAIRSGLDLDTEALLAALPPPGPAADDDPIRRLDALTAHLEPMLEPTP